MRNSWISVLAAGLLLAGSAHAQAPSCQEEVERLRYLVQHYQAGRTSAEFEVARLQVLSQGLQRELDRLRQALQSAPSKGPQ